MLKNGILSLPDNWETILEQIMLHRHAGAKIERCYICSPCQDETAEGIIRNMKAARIYMFYAYIHLACVPIAPHAYLPVLLHDNFEYEREMALLIGSMLIKNCDRILVCGNKLSSGMYGEIKRAAKLRIPIEVFDEQVADSLRAQLANEGIGLKCALYQDNHLHSALSLGSDELAPYWDGDGNA